MLAVLGGLDSFCAAGADVDLLNSNSAPSTIGDDYVVYVDDIENPSAVVGYRDGDIWYNADGLVISDPSLLAEAAGGKIAPYLTDQSIQDDSLGMVNTSAFKDYKPETTFNPRISFSFPISD